MGRKRWGWNYAAPVSEQTCNRVTTLPSWIAQINSDANAISAGRTDRICQSWNGLPQPWVSSISRYKDGGGGCIMNSWWGTTANPQIENGIKEKDGSLEDFQPRGMVSATARKRRAKCCAEWGIKWCQLSYLEWAICRMHSEEGIWVRKLAASLGVFGNLIWIPMSNFMPCRVCIKQSQMVS